MCDMALGLFMSVVVALALLAFVWSTTAMLVIVALALVGYWLCELTGVGGERFFNGGGTHRHRHP
jgi:hypothetical protein